MLVDLNIIVDGWDNLLIRSFIKQLKLDYNVVYKQISIIKCFDQLQSQELVEA